VHASPAFFALNTHDDEVGALLGGYVDSTLSTSCVATHRLQQAKPFHAVAQNVAGDA
jgi:hypothetical protein